MGSGLACAKRSLAVLAGDTIRSESLVIYAHFSFVYISIQIIKGNKMLISWQATTVRKRQLGSNPFFFLH